jgi:GNAT superfamily N-acetyltransferase
MISTRESLFCDLALAARIEQAEVGLITAGTMAAVERGSAGFALPVAGGVASFAEAGSPLNKVAGLGFGGVPDEEQLAAIERAFAACGSPVQVELAHLAAPQIGEALTARGYRLAGFENVLGRAVRDGEQRLAPPGVTVRRSDDDEFDAWLDLAVEAFATPDDQGVASHEEFPHDVLARAVRDLTAAAGVARYCAVRDGALAGVASLRLTEGIAQFTGAATAPAHRRHGVQSALLAARLADAAAAGCDIAVVTTQPGSKSQHNVQRRGFDLLYTRAILIRA